MTGLALDIEDVKWLNLTIDADDVSLWIIGGPVARQRKILQRALEVTRTFLSRPGMAVSTEKAAYVAITNSRGRRNNVADKIQLTIDGNRITREEVVKVLGLRFGETEGTREWVRQVKKHWKQTQALTRGVTAKNWGEGGGGRGIYAENSRAGILHV